MMLTRTQERGCCLTYDYVIDDVTDLLGEKDLDSISVLRGLLVSRPADSSFSHKNALHRCVEHAKLWLAQDREHMGFVSSFLGIFGFAVGIPLGLLVGFFLFVYSETKHVKVNITTHCMFVLFYSNFQHRHMHFFWSLSGDCWCWV